MLELAETSGQSDSSSAALSPRRAVWTGMRFPGLHCHRLPRPRPSSRLNSMQAVLVILYQVRPNIKKSIAPASEAISPQSQQYSTTIYSFNSTFGNSPQPSIASLTTSTLKHSNPCLASPRPPPASLAAENRKKPPAQSYTHTIQALTHARHLNFSLPT